MAEQRLHSQLAPLDLLTRIELEETLHKEFGAAIRERDRGLDVARIPPVIGQGNNGTLNLASGGANDAIAGPEQGDVWMLRRVNVTSSAFTTDTARYLVFRGSTPSDTANAYSNRQLLEGISQSPGGTTMAQPVVPATGVAQQNTTNQAQTVVISANGATISNVSVNGITVGSGAGTYVVPAYGSISISYTVATPTWVWTGTQTFTLGQQVGIGYYPATKAVFLQPGEQIYAQVYNSVAGNSYILSGEAIRVPAEMKGKVL